ncbi:MAG TPA: DUF1080 domain-containing protein [Pirellulales bacterium]|nr:DUF1080 domain-containing protein [Pirellulales bacterium]
MKLPCAWLLVVLASVLYLASGTFAADAPTATAAIAQAKLDTAQSKADSAQSKADKDQFVSLFNGKDLTGWHGDPDLWKVTDGVIVGTTDDKQIKHNSFLISDKPYKNFVLKADFKLRNHNSGIQFRSVELPEFDCKGYQADMADKRYTGILHEEKGRIIVADVKEDEVKQHYTPGEWAHYVITADGPHIKQEINGYTTIDYTEPEGDKTPKEGILGLQLHAGQKMEVEFKNIEIKELP